MPLNNRKIVSGNTCKLFLLAIKHGVFSFSALLTADPTEVIKIKIKVVECLFELFVRLNFSFGLVKLTLCKECFCS